MEGFSILFSSWHYEDVSMVLLQANPALGNRILPLPVFLSISASLYFYFLTSTISSAIVNNYTKVLWYF